MNIHKQKQKQNSLDLNLTPYTKNLLKMKHKPNVKHKIAKLLEKKHSRKSLRPRAMRTVLRFDMKSRIHKKKMINWTSSKVKMFVLRKILRDKKTNYRVKEYISHIANKGTFL